MNKNPNIIMQLSGYLPGVILVLVSGIVLFWYTWPTIQMIPDSQRQVGKLESEVTELKNKQNILASLNISELETLSKKADNALPTEKSFAGLLTGLELLAKDANSDLLNFDASPGLISTQSGQSQIVGTAQSVSLPKNLQPLAASIGLTSNPASLIDLTTKLEKSSRLITLEAVNFDASSVGNGSQNTTIKLNVYFQPANDASASAADKLENITQEEKNVIAEVDSYNRFSLNVPTKFSPRFDPFAPIGPTAPAASGSSVLAP